MKDNLLKYNCLPLFLSCIEKVVLPFILICTSPIQAYLGKGYIHTRRLWLSRRDSCSQSWSANPATILWRKRQYLEYESVSRNQKPKIAFRHFSQMFVILCNTSLDLQIRWNAAVWLQYVDLSQRAWQKPRVGLNFLKSACTVLFHVSPHDFY